MELQSRLVLFPTFPIKPKPLDLLRNLSRSEQAERLCCLEQVAGQNPKHSRLLKKRFVYHIALYGFTASNNFSILLDSLGATRLFCLRFQQQMPGQMARLFRTTYTITTAALGRGGSSYRRRPRRLSPTRHRVESRPRSQAVQCLLATHFGRGLATRLVRSRG